MFRRLVYSALITYVLTWVGMFLLIMIVVLLNDRSLSDGWQFFRQNASSSSFLGGIHVTFLFVFLIYRILRYYVLVWRKRGFVIFVKRLFLYLLLPLGAFYGLIEGLQYYNTQEDFDYSWDHSIENKTGQSPDRFATDSVHRGMSVFGFRESNEAQLDQLVTNNVEWVAVIPFIYQRDEQTASVNQRSQFNEWSRRDSLFLNRIEQLKGKGMRVHLKPHLWLSSGWRSNISLSNETDWDSWFESYRNHMLHYARLAEYGGVELFCVGTELNSSITQQPEKWRALIAEIREIYSGPLTYAANWDGEFERVGFWDQLDYIGIQGYFELTPNKNPSLEEIKKGWGPYVQQLQAFSELHDKPILFTEIGYKSEATATVRPWEWSSFLHTLTRKKSDRTQVLAYRALFETVWQEPWFAGMYIWQWDFRSSKENAATNFNFSPRFKAAENEIAKGYALPKSNSNPP